MKLIIDIPEELYDDIKENGLCGYCSDLEIASEAIRKGIPLPKGHGRLLDEDKLLTMLVFGKYIDDCKCGDLAEICNKTVILEADWEKI